VSLCCLDCRVTKGVMYFEERGFWSCFCIFSVPRKDGGFISRKNDILGFLVRNFDRISLWKSIRVST